MQKDTINELYANFEYDAKSVQKSYASKEHLCKYGIVSNDTRFYINT